MIGLYSVLKLGTVSSHMNWVLLASDISSPNDAIASGRKRFLHWKGVLDDSSTNYAI
jgi:hypothetical protein